MYYLLFLLPIAFVILALVVGNCGGSWVKEDGTIVEWDGDGGGRILHPDGRLEEFPRKGAIHK